jgi:hypothetical protein
MTCAHELSQKQPHHDQEPDALGMTMLSDGMMGRAGDCCPMDGRAAWSMVRFNGATLRAKSPPLTTPDQTLVFVLKVY